jgi:hypothetical protein
MIYNRTDWCRPKFFTSLSSFRLSPLAFLAVVLFSSSVAQAHMLPYLAWFTVQRTMEIHTGEIRINYDCKFNPVIFDPKSPLMDTDMDSTASSHEMGAFCLQADQYLAADLVLLLNGAALASREESFFMRDDNSGFQAVFTAALPPLEEGPHTVDWIDPCFLPTALPIGMTIEQTTGTITAAEKNLKLIDVPNANSKTARLQLPDTFRTTIIFEKAGVGESNSSPVKSKNDKTTTPVTRKPE